MARKSIEIISPNRNLNLTTLNVVSTPGRASNIQLVSCNDSRRSRTRIMTNASPESKPQGAVIGVKVKRARPFTAKTGRSTL